MTNKKTKLFDFFTKLKKGILLEDKIGSDSRSTPSPEDSTRELKEEDKTDLTTYERYIEFQKQNKENYKEFVNQDIDSTMLKLNRPYATNDSVVLLNDYPDEDLYRGYVCIILDILYDYSYPFENNAAHDYEVFFKSTFDKKDLLSSEPGITVTIPGRDLLRIETQDLRYRSSFPKMF